MENISDRPDSGAFEAFRERVLADPALLDRLRRTEGTEEFLAATTELARDMGFSLSRGQVQQALQAARREWIERWIA